MDRARFEQHFHEAAAATRDFAREYIEEPLPDAMRFRVHLNSSHDRNAGPDFTLFPEDSSRSSALYAKELSAEEVIDILWRDGLVPQWVDLQVVGEAGTATILDVVSCGRFIADEGRLYYTWTERAPFGPKGPTLPIGYVPGQRFSIYYRSCCHSLADLERAKLSGARVWSLELRGAAFDDDALLAGLSFPQLEILELIDTPIVGRGFRALAELPKLRVLRTFFHGPRTLDFADVPPLPALEVASFRALPATLTGIDTLARTAPRLTEVTLASVAAVESNATLTTERVHTLALEFPSVPAWVVPPSTLRSLTLHASTGTDAEVAELLARCPVEMDSVGLRGTPVSDEIVAALERFPGL